MTLRSGPCLLLAILLLAAPIAAAQGGSQQPTTPGGDHTTGKPATSPADAERASANVSERAWSNLSTEKRAAAQEKAERAGLFSLIEYADGHISGKYVDATLDPATGALSAYTVKDGNTSTTYLDAVTLTAIAGVTPKATGAVLRVMGDLGTLAIHNNPTAQLLILNGNATTTLAIDVADGVTLTRDNDHTYKLAKGSAHAHLILAGNGTLANSTTGIDATLDASATLIFINHPLTPTPLASDLHALNAARASGRLGGELSVVNASGVPAEEHTGYGVTMSTSALAKNGVTVRVSSANATGRALVVNLDKATLANATGQNVTVKIDGIPATRANNASAVLNGAPSGAATFSVSEAGDGVQVTLSVPGFSDHDVTISGTETTTSDGATVSTPPTNDAAADTGETGTSKGTPAPGVLAALAAIGVALLVRKRRA